MSCEILSDELRTVAEAAAGSAFLRPAGSLSAKMPLYYCAVTVLILLALQSARAATYFWEGQVACGDHLTNMLESVCSGVPLKPLTQSDFPLEIQSARAMTAELDVTCTSTLHHKKYIPRLTEVLCEAFADDPLWNALVPDPSEKRGMLAFIWPIRLRLLQNVSLTITLKEGDAITPVGHVELSSDSMVCV